MGDTVYIYNRKVRPSTCLDFRMMAPYFHVFFTLAVTLVNLPLRQLLLDPLVYLLF